MIIFCLVDLIIKQSALINYLVRMILEHDLQLDEIEKEIDVIEKLLNEIEMDLK